MLIFSGAPLWANSRPISQPSTLIAQSTTAESFYQNARAELPEELYLLYRIVERVARANGLDDRPWRVAVVPDYDINAFATEVNLLAFFTGLIDQLYGDPDAIAFVVAHEMGHHTSNHIVLGQAEEEDLRQQLLQEAIDEVAAEEEDLRDDLQAIDTGAYVASGAGSLIDWATDTGGISSLVGGLISSIFQGNRQRRLEEAVERVDAINTQKQEELDRQIAAASQEREFEADESGYLFAVQAGFKPEGGLRAMDVLNRNIGSQDAASHPAVPDRIAHLEELQRQYPPTALKSEGDAELATSPNPLTYALSLDGVSLRINSRSGSGDIDDLLPQ